MEAEPCDIRFVSVLACVGVIFDLRTALYSSTDWATRANVAVLVVGGVTGCSSMALGHRLCGWEVAGSADHWLCRMQLDRAGTTVISGYCASVYGGMVPDLPDAQPLFGTEDRNTIRRGWPTWQSDFVITVEPEHTRPNGIPGSIYPEHRPGCPSY